MGWRSVSVEFDLTDPDVWETLLGWMKEQSLVPQTAVMIGELTK
jgi:hypothetical protein